MWRDFNRKSMYNGAAMKPNYQKIYYVAGLVIATLFSAAPGYSQKPQLSEDAFKNVQVLRGIPVKEFMETMGFFAASLSLNCTDCHGDASASSWANYATDTPLKNTARRMVGRSTIILGSIQPNAPVDAAKFAKPDPPR